MENNDYKFDLAAAVKVFCFIISGVGLAASLFFFIEYGNKEVVATMCLAVSVFALMVSGILSVLIEIRDRLSQNNPK